MARSACVARLLAGLALVLTLAVGFGSVAGAQDTAGVEDNGLASVTVYKAVCPEGYEGEDYFEDCYDTPGAEFVFGLSNDDAVVRRSA